MDLLQFVSNNKQTSLLLMGKEGFSMKEDALALAKALLKSDNLDVHPDFLYVTSDKSTLGVDDILPIIEKGSHPPFVADRTIVVIDKMHTLTVVAQNKLLLLLENNPYVFVVGICFEDTILQTVKSRMRIVSYMPLTKKEFISQSNLPEDDAELFFISSGGSLGLLEKLLGNKEIFHALKNANIYHSAKDRIKILEILHLANEKDKEAVTSDPVLMKAVLRLLAHIFIQLAIKSYAGNPDEVNRLLEIAALLVEEEDKVTSPGYTKHDFFKAMVYCIEH